MLSVTLKYEHSVSPSILWRNKKCILSLQTTQENLKAHLRDFFQLKPSLDTSVFNVWCCHKAFSRSLLIQVSSRERRYRKLKLQRIRKNCYLLQKFVDDSLKCRQEFWLLLMPEQEKSLQKIKAKFYSHSNKAGKLLAPMLKAKKLKTQLSSITHNCHTVIPKTLTIHSKNIIHPFSI